MVFKKPTLQCSQNETRCQEGFLKYSPALKFYKLALKLWDHCEREVCMRELCCPHGETSVKQVELFCRHSLIKCIRSGLNKWREEVFPDLGFRYGHRVFEDDPLHHLKAGRWGQWAVVDVVLVRVVRQQGQQSEGLQWAALPWGCKSATHSLLKSLNYL